MKTRNWFLLFLLWQIAGVIVSTIMAISAGNFHFFMHELIMCLTFTNFVGICTSALVVAYEQKLKFVLNRLLLTILGILIFIGVMYLGLRLGLSVGGQICGFDNYDVGRWHLAIIIVNFIILVATTIFAVLLLFYQRMATNLERKINENAKLTRLQLESRFALLQAKINPHFLFNTLNSMLDVLRRDPQQVEKMVLNLSDIYRKTLAVPERKFVSIDEEMELVREYLEIEKIRMGDRLNYQFAIEEKLLRTPIPPMMLQILVENAVKHGLTPQKSGGNITVKVALDGDKIHVGVEDTGVGINQDRVDTGYGLTCIKQQLKLLYDSAAAMRISLLPQGGTHVMIEIPYEA